MDLAAAMASASAPTPPEPQVNLTTPAFGPFEAQMPPPLFNLPHRPVTPSSQPGLTLHQYRQLQYSPVPSHFSSVSQQRLRRQPSHSDLAGRSVDGASWSAHSGSVRTLNSTRSLRNFSPSLLLPLPTTPCIPHFAISPSLSSTVTTAPSSPSPPPPTIVNGSYPSSPRLLGEQSGHTPLSYKRKFAVLRQAKRLPHPEQQAWQVHATIQAFDPPPASPASESEEGDNLLVEAGTAAKAARSRAEKRRALNVQFEGADSGSEVEDGRDSTARAVHDLSAISSPAPSNCQFPAPPGHNWTGTFGHLGKQTPPKSPATLHYRGTSFDVVNPHDSLLLGTHQFETPGELDALLNDYFSEKPSLEDFISDRSIEQMASQDSLAASDSSRRTRVLYANYESARRNIMHVEGDNPNARSNDDFSLRDLQATVPQPLQVRKQEKPPTRAKSIRNSVLRRFGLGEQRDEPATHMHELQELEEAQTPMAGGDNYDAEQRLSLASSIYPPSGYNFSNPFDSDDRNERAAVLNDDSQGNFANESDHQLDHPPDRSIRERPSGDLSFNSRGDIDQLQRSENERDTTLDRLVGQYARPRSPEYEGPGYIVTREGEITSLSDGNDSDWQTEIGRSYPRDIPRSNTAAAYQGVYSRPYRLRHPITGPPTMPVPPPPAFVRNRNGTRPFRHYSSEELPPSEQTYGVTDELLHTVSLSDTSNDGERRVEVPRGFLGAPDQDTPNLHGTTSSRNLDKGKENVVPASIFRLDMPMANLNPVHRTELPPMWSSPDLRQARSRAIRDADISATSGHLSQGRPSHDESGWITEDDVEEVGHRQMPLDARTAHFPRSTSCDSYADTSVYGSEDNEDLEADERTPRAHQSSHPDAKSLRRQLHINAMDRSIEALIPGKSLEQIGQARRRQGQADLKQASQRQEILRNNEGPGGRYEPTLALLREDSPLDKIRKSKIDFWRNTAPSTRSDTDRLIRGSDASGGTGYGSNLAYSDTNQTFQTLGGRETITPNSGFRMPPAQPWTPLEPSPLSPLPTAHVPRSMLRMPPRTEPSTPLAMLSRPPQLPIRLGNPASMRSQKALRPLALPRQVSDAFPPRTRRGPFTDQELMERETRWSVTPDFSPNGPLGRFAYSEAARRNYITPAEAAQISMLQTPQRLRNPPPANRAEEQKKVSKLWFEICCVLPFAPALYGLGGLDWIVEGKTDGRVMSMEPKLKGMALRRALPLNAVAWVIIAFAILSLVL